MEYMRIAKIARSIIPEFANFRVNGKKIDNRAKCRE